MAETDLKDEYLDVSDNIRHWNTLRFAELTIYVALTGAPLNAIIEKSPRWLPSESPRWMMHVGTFSDIIEIVAAR